MNPKSLTIVTHCWRFSRVLNYQLSSLVLHLPKKMRVSIEVYCNQDDGPTKKVLDYFRPLLTPKDEDDPTGLITINLPLPTLWNRTIGRNQAALACDTDLIWFADADYCFGEGCLDALCDLDLTERHFAEVVPHWRSLLYYPAWSWINNTHELGDQYALRAKRPGLYDINPKDFKVEKYKKAIGGIQIVPGEVAKQYGYCKGDERRLRPSPNGWKQTHEDGAFRKSLGTKGTSVELPNLYRIRQLVQWQVDTVEENEEPVSVALEPPE
jgi:hypothetical protein